MRTRLLLVVLISLGPSAAQAGTIVTGLGSGGAPQVRVFDSGTATPLSSFLAYGATFTGGVRVAAGDVNGDGVTDIVTGAGPGGGSHIKVFDGATGAVLFSFFAFDPSFSGGVFVAAGDVNGDGKADIVAGADAGGAPHVKVFDGVTGMVLRSFFAYDAQFSGGVRVAAGDVNGDGVADIVTGAGPGASSHVKVFDGHTGSVIRSFFAFDPSFSGGVFVAAGDVSGDGNTDIVVGADSGGSPHVKVFDAVTVAVIRSFFAFDPSFGGGVRVAAGDVNGDGIAEIVTGAGPGAGPHVQTFDGVTGALIGSFFSGAPGFTGGVFVAASSSQPVDTTIAAAGAAGFQQGVSLLQNALRSLQLGDSVSACNMLDGFIHQVEAQAGKKLTVEQANQLTALALNDRIAIGCR